MVKTKTVSDRLGVPNFRSWSMKACLANAFAVLRLYQIQEFHLWQLRNDCVTCNSQIFVQHEIACDGQMAQDIGRHEYFSWKISHPLWGPEKNELNKSDFHCHTNLRHAIWVCVPSGLMDGPKSWDGHSFKKSLETLNHSMYCSQKILNASWKQSISSFLRATRSS